MNWKFLKSIMAVLSGLIVVIILSNGTDMILEAAGIFPSVEEQSKTGFSTPWMAALALAYRLAYMIAGGYIVSILSPGKPSLHVIVLGAIGSVLGIMGAIVTWGFAPAWFLLGPVVLGIPCVLVGGRLHEAKSL